MKTRFGIPISRHTAVVVAALVMAYLCGSWLVGYLPMAVVVAGVACLYLAARRATAIRPSIRIVVIIIGLLLTWGGSVDKIESIYLCHVHNCPLVRVTVRYRLIGATLYHRSYDATLGGATCTETGNDLFLVAKFRYFGLLWQQFTADSPPPGVKKLSK